MADQRIPKVNIPLTVNTTGMDAPLKAAERKVRATADRIAKMKTGSGGGGGGMALGKAASQAGLSMGGFGALGAVGGAMGGAGAGVGLALSPFIASTAILSMFDAATKGASDALAKFQGGAEQTFAKNGVILERLASMEKTSGSVGKGTMAQAFLSGSSTDGQAGGAVKWANEFQDGARIFAAGVGAFLSGKTWEQVKNEASLATANDSGAAIIKRNMEQQRIVDTAEGYQGFGAAPISWAFDRAIENSSTLQWAMKQGI